MKLRRRTRYVALSVTAAVGVTAFLIGPAGSSTGGATPEEEEARALAESPSRTLPSGPNDVLVMGVWRNGEFHVIKLRTETTETYTPSGTAGNVSTVSSREEIEAQLPPVDPSIDPRTAPTQTQIVEMEARVHAEQLKYRQAGSLPGPFGR